MDISKPIVNSHIRNQELNKGSNNSIPKVQNGEVRVADQKTPDERKFIDRRDLYAAVDKANKVLFKNDTYLKFSVHEKTKDIMVKIIDNSTGEVLKELPPEKLLDMVAKIWEIAGIFVDEKR